MPANSQITAALVVAGEVPSDQNCLTDVNALLPTIAAYMGVQAQDPQAPQSQSNSVADLALNTANNALAQISALEALIPTRRTSGSNVIPIAASGDSNVTLTWNPDMPSINYAVYLTFHGPIGVSNADLLYYVVDQSRTVASVQVRILNVPAGTWSFTWEVIAL